MEKDKKFTNNLINESSPYLLQHAHNPVNWFPWSEEAFKKAKDENKLVIISIGYSACHWCHVMERQSFTDEETAGVMNRHFISIKVDREERPDIDNIYMMAAQLITGKGGWPLNCIALPDGRPVYAGTYYSKENWMGLLLKLTELYKNDHDKLLEQAKLVAEGVQSRNIAPLPKEKSDFKEDIILRTIEKWKESFDKSYGGAVGSPKFSMPNGTQSLLRYYYHKKDEEVNDYLITTLNSIINGGIYDHVGGGFARYSTDAYWKIPHFEKMLYDNAQLISLYSEAYRLFKDERYKKVVLETIEFLKTDLSNPGGGFYSAIDADSDGEEGKYYAWKVSEIDDLLGKNSELFKLYYNCVDEGNWTKGTNILHITDSLKKLAQQNDVGEDFLITQIKESINILREEREKREKPGTDTKILTSWNALAITGLVDAYRAVGDEEILQLAIDTADFLCRELLDEKSFEVYRTRKKNGAPIPGFLDDYGLLGAAFLDLYQVTFNDKWLSLSGNLTKTAISKFYIESQQVFSYKSNEDEELFSKNIELTDNVIPSSNSIMANLLFQLSVHLDSEEYREMSRNLLNLVIKGIDEYPAFFSNWVILLMKFLYKNQQIVFTGSNSMFFRNELDKDFHMAAIAGAIEESERPLLKDRFITDKSLIYFCEDNVCNLPVEDINELKKQLFND